ncbi:hypothetical protein LG204_12305 [Methylovorus menthalis]|uniref:hypothetical protein n=1 Tax=Methylovorus menthalis TaxID=1002227 RepID=UPI001E562B42|nr:hypothetical protein [Methylovorus menthalis]MCB4812097.1 hypothetical protein [Methylovorus menthalis]
MMVVIFSVRATREFKRAWYRKPATNTLQGLALCKCLFRLLAQGLLGLGRHLVPIAIHHAQAMIATQTAVVPGKKIPVKRIEWTGTIACFSGLAVVATLAMVAHAINVGSTGEKVSP